MAEATRGNRLRVLVLVLMLAPLLSTGLGRSAVAADKLEKIRVDYAYYNPSSLVLRKFGWLEEEFKADEVEIEWVFSAGSNKANEYLRADAVDFGSTAGAAALLARANGSEIKTVYVFSKPEWAALVVPADSEITEVAQLKGKKIAATKGTDPYFFLLRSLNQAGLTGSDVEVVNLQHADGKTALERGDVDAWAGLDPFMAQTELEAGSKLLYRNIDFNSFGFLNAREEFINDHPEEITRILTAYERARQWILDNPDEAAQILADEAKLSLEVAQRELADRTVLTTTAIPGEEHAAVLAEIIPIFQSEDQVKEDTDVQAVLDELFAPQFIQEIVEPTA